MQSNPPTLKDILGRVEICGNQLIHRSVLLPTLNHTSNIKNDYKKTKTTSEVISTETTYDETISDDWEIPQ